MSKERKGRYNYEELEILHQYFKKEGKDILKRLPGRTWNSVLKAAIHEGLHDNTVVWLPEEDAILYNNQNLTATELVKLMPWRTQRSITVRRSRLGCPHRVCWTAEEEAILRECTNTDEACERINRSRVAILKKAISLGIDLDTINVWTEKDDEIMNRYFISESYDVRIRLNHSVRSIKAHLWGEIASAKPNWSMKTIHELIRGYERCGIDILRDMPDVNIYEAFKILKDFDKNINFWNFAEDKKIQTYGNNIILPGREPEIIKWRSSHLFENVISTHNTNNDEKEDIVTRFPKEGYKLLEDYPMLRYYNLCLIVEKRIGVEAVPRYTGAELDKAVSYIKDFYNRVHA